VDRTIHEHDGVALLRDLPHDGLIAGDIGVAVFVHGDGIAYEVEFSNPARDPRFLVLTVEAGDLLKLQPRGRPGRAA